jgi:hypothetical protein
MRYRVVQFTDGNYALERMTTKGILWWKKVVGSGQYKSLSGDYHWKRNDGLEFCTSKDKEKMLDLADRLNENEDGIKVITRNPLEKLL